MLALVALAALAAPIADGVVVDPVDPSLVFVMRPDGGVAAVDVDKGRTRWTSALGDKPLEAHQGALLVVSDRGADGTIGVRLLSTRTGDLLADCGPLSLPAWAPGLGDHLGSALHTRGDVRKDALVASWHASTWYAGGAPPPPEVEAAARQEAGGGLACTAVGGRPVDEVTAEPRRGAVVERREVDGRQAWVRAPAGRGEPRVLQESGVWGAASIDGRHAVVVAWTPVGGTVYDTATGDVVGVVPGYPSGAGFVVVGGRLITGGTGAVYAVDLGTGAERWRVDVRDLTFRGPYPP